MPTEVEMFEIGCLKVDEAYLLTAKNSIDIDRHHYVLFELGCLDLLKMTIKYYEVARSVQPKIQRVVFVHVRLWLTQFKRRIKPLGFVMLTKYEHDIHAEPIYLEAK